MEYFKFKERTISNFFIYNLRVINESKKSFNYIIENLKPQTDLDNLKWTKTKNYEWITISIENDIFIIRNYDMHFTVYCKFKSEYGYDFCIFTLKFDNSLITDDNLHDHIHDNRTELFFDELLKIKKTLHEGVPFDLLWNDLAFPRETYIKIKTVLYGETINSYDDLIFALEEISNIHFQLFAENEMFDKIKTLKPGDKLKDGSTIVNIRTELNDDYYHNIGITIKNDSEVFYDVYRLTEYYLDKLF